VVVVNEYHYYDQIPSDDRKTAVNKEEKRSKKARRTPG
jgi:hypothetical protein